MYPTQWQSPSDMINLLDERLSITPRLLSRLQIITFIAADSATTTSKPSHPYDS
jgi:hypothetical protein